MKHLGPFATKVRERRRALRHAAAVVGPAFAENLLFRCGPCDVCSGRCFCRPDSELLARVRSGMKPVASFCAKDPADLAELRTEGLACWSGVNRWGVHVLVTSAVPDVLVPGVGTPRVVAFTQAFIDESLPLSHISALYGYCVALAQT